MRNEADTPSAAESNEATDTTVRRLLPDYLPAPTAQFRRRAWLAFQRALDPLAPPRPPRLPRL